MPSDLQMKESERVSLELLDEVLDKALGMHVLTPFPVKMTKQIVKLDHVLSPSHS